MSKTLSDSDRLDWLQLIRSENVGPITFRRLLTRFGTARAALEALPELASKGGAKARPKIFSRSAAEQELDFVTRLGGRLLAWCEPEYPQTLAAVEDAPPLLAAGANIHLLNKPAVAVVGARNASLNGRKLAETIAGELSSAGIIVVSGLARGIDTAVHEASLVKGTIAVVAGGIDVIYPPENAELQKSIFNAGAIVSEMPPGMQPTQRLFPRRNRIIAGLSRGVLVVEAAPQSGSLITAQLALDQGREVFAVPGSPLDPRAQGTNGLIRNGAHLVERAEDILTVLQDMTGAMKEQATFHFAEAPATVPDERELLTVRQAILECLSPSPTSVDEVVRDCHVSTSLVSAVLLELELAGRLERQPGNKVSLI